MTVFCNFGYGPRFYRVVTIAPLISASVFEYYNVARGAWRPLRNVNARWELWHKAQS